MKKQDTIVALATASGSGAIAIIRLSGENAIEIAQKIFTPHSKKSLFDLPSHTVHLGYIFDNEQVIDECLVTLFKGNRSYTGEPSVEISCHASRFVQQKIVEICVKNGARIAQAGEFTMRAFLNGKMDLSQAEAVADLIASDSKASHQVALNQMRGGFSEEIKKLRTELLDFASLIELELDFSEEDVEFADRTAFVQLLQKIETLLKNLTTSFSLGNAIKNGVPVSIVGNPNVGKSTLLNALLNEEKAIVSNIAGTTRDAIEDEMIIDGISFRFIDTAGIRDTADVVESIGIQRTFQKMEKSQIIIYMFDTSLLMENLSDFQQNIEQLHKYQLQFDDKSWVLVANKSDLLSEEQKQWLKNHYPEVFFLSAQNNIGVEMLKNQLVTFVNAENLNPNQTIVTNLRHYEALSRALTEVKNIQQGLDLGLSSDLLAIDIRQALFHLGEITGEVTNDEVLGNIFSKFCIGK